MSRRTVDQRLQALVGQILVPRPEAVGAGRVPATRIHAVVAAPTVELPNGGRQTVAVAWPIDLTHRGWTHPALDEFYDHVSRRTFVEARPRTGRQPLALPRAHLDYEVATLGRVLSIEAAGHLMAAEQDAASVLISSGLPFTPDILRELVTAVASALRAPAPANTLKVLTEGRGSF